MFDNFNLDLKVDKMSPQTYRKIGPMMPFLMEIAISTKRQFERGREKSIKINQLIYLKIRNHSACEEETTRKMVNNPSIKVQSKGLYTKLLLV